ncbi:MAG: N-acetylmuramoyl-L-alanine amidase [Actinomycetia bacterium]|nr:N-acetylmuramoyl-L-alanine amidase [Actinomycetes bacterium]
MRFPRPAPAGALFAVVLVVPAAVVAPTFTVPKAAPHAVSAQVQQVRLAGVDAAALRSAPIPDELASSWRELSGRSAAGAARAAERPPVVVTEPLDTDSYRMMGVTWKGAAPSEDGAVVVTARTRTDGRWTDWFELHTMVDGGTEVSPNGRFATVPYWAGDSDGVQIRVDAVGADVPRDVRADLIEPGTSDADAAITEPWSGSTASASTDKPPIVTRAQWGADESLRDKRLENSQTIDVAFVHHTAGSNSYTRSESPAVVRGLYSYYVNTLKYADMGYNFLVDKYGTIYEGRAGSITKPVRGAATGGFNTDSMTVVAIGNFEKASASDAMIRGIAKVLAYRLSRYHRDPYGTKALTAEVGSSRYSEGEKARFKVISGHRDAGYTACPGQHLYDRLPAIRKLTAGYMGAGLVEPTMTTANVPMGGDVDVAVHSRVLQQQNWALTVREFCTGDVVRRMSGTASRSTAIETAWRGRDDNGNFAPPGRYRVTLTSTGNGTTAWPFARSVLVGVGGRSTAPTTTSLGATPAGAYVPQRPRTLVSSTSGTGIKDRLILGADRRLDVKVLGRAGVPTSGVSAVAISVEASCVSAGTRISVSPDTVTGTGARVLSLGANATAQGFAIVRVGPGGGIRFHNLSGAVALKASVVGYVSTNGAGGSLTPLRRTTLGGASPLAVSSSAVSVDVAGRSGVPADARAVVLAIRRTGDSSVGAVWAWPNGGEQAAAATWRRPRGSGSVAQVIVPLGDNGGIRVAADRSGPISLDVAGYVAAGDSSDVHPVVPRTLIGNGVRLNKGDASTVSVRGRAGVPSDATAVVVQLTGSSSRAPGRLMLWPRGASEPRSADLIVPARGARDTLAVMRLGKGGDLRVRSRDSTLRANLSVVGWIR